MRGNDVWGGKTVGNFDSQWVWPDFDTFEVSVSVDADVALVRGAGELDVSSSEKFLAGLDQAWDAPAPAVVIDLRDVTFIDVRGLHTLAEAGSHARQLGRQLTIRDPNGRVRRVAQLAHVEGLPLEPAD